MNTVLNVALESVRGASHCQPWQDGGKPCEFSEQLAPGHSGLTSGQLQTLRPFRTCASSFSPSGWERKWGRLKYSHSGLIRTLDHSRVLIAPGRGHWRQCSAQIPAPEIRTPFHTVLAIHPPPLEGLSLTALSQASTVMRVLFSIILQKPTG